MAQSAWRVQRVNLHLIDLCIRRHSSFEAIAAYPWPSVLHMNEIRRTEIRLSLLQALISWDFFGRRHNIAILGRSFMRAMDQTIGILTL